MVDYKSLFIKALSKNKDHTKWDKGDFIGIKTISNTKVGSVGQDFIEALCKELSLTCEFPMNKKSSRATQNPWDIKINKVSFELKTATEDTNNNFQFNHIRYHRSYEAVLCLGVTPNSIYFNVWSKAQISTGKSGKLVTMEKGANASYKLTKSAKTLLPISEFKRIILDFTEKFEH